MSGPRSSAGKSTTGPLDQWTPSAEYAAWAGSRGPALELYFVTILKRRLGSGSVGSRTIAPK